MDIAIVYDTETSDMIQDCRDSDDRQPHLVQLAATLIDLGEKKTLQQMDVTIKPDGWSFSSGAVDTHGITEEYARDIGISEKVAVEMFIEMSRSSLDDAFHLFIGHNINFDARIMRIAMKRYEHRELALAQKDSEHYCTMKESTQIVQCPPTPKMIKAGRNHFKNPNLGEAFKYFTGAELSGAHNAMVDVQATMAVYYGIQDYNSTPNEVAV